MYEGYIYKLVNKTNNRIYIGSRYAKDTKIGDIGITYFTSSKIVRPIFKTNVDEFNIFILETYKHVNHKEVVEYIRTKEAYILQIIDVHNDEQYYNQTVGNGRFHSAGMKHNKGRQHFINNDTGKHISKNPNEVDMSVYTKHSPNSNTRAYRHIESNEIKRYNDNDFQSLLDKELWVKHNNFKGKSRYVDEVNNTEYYLRNDELINYNHLNLVKIGKSVNTKLYENIHTKEIKRFSDSSEINFDSWLPYSYTKDRKPYLINNSIVYLNSKEYNKREDKSIIKHFKKTNTSKTIYVYKNKKLVLTGQGEFTSWAKKNNHITLGRLRDSYMLNTKEDDYICIDIEDDLYKKYNIDELDIIYDLNLQKKLTNDIEKFDYYIYDDNQTLVYYINKVGLNRICEYYNLPFQALRKALKNNTLIYENTNDRYIVDEYKKYKNWKIEQVKISR